MQPTKNRISYLLVLLALLATGLYCKKSASTVSSPASFNVINVLSTQAGNGVLPIFGQLDSPYSYLVLSPLGYNSTFLYSPLAGQNSFYIVNSKDTFEKQALFTGNFHFQQGGIYSFFLCGDSTGTDTLLTQDNIPYYPYSGDSLVGVRFVNLSKGSQSFSVTLQGNPPSQTEFSTIPYKGVTPFTSYGATASVGGSYSFVLRDAMTGDSITSYAWNYTIFRSNTIIISGAVAGGPFPLQLWQMNNY